MKDNNNKENNSRLSPGTLALAVGSIGLGAFVVWLVIFAILGGETTTRTAMLLQLSQVLAQVVLVTLLGTTLSFIYNLYAKDQEQRRLQLQKEDEQRRLQIDEDNQLRRELLASVIAVRAQVERARRSFQLLPDGEKKAGYRAAIEQVLDARLRLSQVWHDSETWIELYAGRGEEIQEKLNGMKDFLDQLIAEYEGCHADILAADERTSVLKIGDLFYFGNFVKGKGGALYQGDFLLKNYRPAAQIIRQSILESSN